MEREHTIYLTSTGSLDIFPENNACKFINRLASPINLDPNYDYEIGLVSILYPNDYYAIIGHQYKNSISFITQLKGNKGLSRFTYVIQNNILAGDIKNLIQVINNELILRLAIYYDRNYTTLFPTNKILFWDTYTKKTGITYTGIPHSIKISKGDVQNVSIRFGEEIANVLGFRSDTEYEIYGTQDDKTKTLSQITVNDKCGVEYMYLYTDIIQPTNFGNQLVNILDCFTFDQGNNKGIHNTLYKPLNTPYIDQISIMITDQKGRAINFKQDTTLTCVLHIRPK